MKIIKFLSIVIVFLLVLVAGLVTALNVVDINRYKGVLEQQISKVTGREFALDGDSELAVSLQPRILLRDVRLKNASWGSEVEMLKVGEAELQVALIPLLMNRVEVLKLSISALDLVLESDKEGNSNWAFGNGEAKPEAVSDTESGGIRMEIALNEVHVENTRILYKGRGGRQAGHPVEFG